MANNLAYYIRLSEADEDTGKEKDESESISNQRALILKYLKDHPEFDDWNIHEFVDDGYTGTNGDRPQFQRMVDLVQQRAKIHISFLLFEARFYHTHIPQKI